MPSCCAYNCSNRSENGYIMKVFPKDAQRRSVWTSKVKRENWKPTKNSYLCEIHFDKNQWEKVRIDGKKKLKLSAIPTIFNHQPVKLVRKSPKKRFYNSTTPSPIKRARRNLTEHSYSTTSKELIPSLDELSTVEDNNNTQTDIQVVSTDVLERNNLLKQIDDLKKEALQRAKIIRELRLKQNSCLKINFKQKVKYSTVTNNLKLFLNENQILSLSVKNKKGFLWTSDTIKKALRLKFACGSSGYEELLAQNQPLPSLGTIQRKLQNISFESGILHDIFEMLKIKIAPLNESHKECVLVLDEMFLTEGVVYDVASKSFIGNVTLPEHEGIANHALVFMLGGIASRWKQTVAYYFTSNSVNGRMLKPIIDSIILKAETIGLQVNSVTSDIAMWNSYGVNCSIGGCINNSVPHPYDPNRTLYFLPDVPHLFKNIKQALLNNKIITIPKDIMEKNNLTSNTVDCKHIEELCRHQNDFELKLFRKIDLNDFKKPNHFDKMNVTKAKNVINMDVCASLECLVDNEGFHSSYKTTAWFIKQVSKWFTLMSSRNPVVALSKFNEDKYFETLSFLKEFMHLFRSIKIGHKGKWKLCQSGVLLATQSILDLQNLFLNEKNFRFLLTSRFTQDCLENLFSSIRSIQAIPNVMQFKYSLKLVCVAQYLKNISNSNYDQDDREFLGDLLDFSKIPKIMNPQMNEETDFCDEISDFESDEIIINNTEQNSLYNIAGYIVSRIENNDKICNNCVDSVCSLQPLNTSYSAFVSLKEYKLGSLKYVNENCFQFFLKMEKLFRQHRSLILSNKRKLFMNILTSELVNFTSCECHVIKNKMINRFIEFRYKNLSSLLTKNIKKSEACSKASKSVAMREAIRNKK